MSGMPGGSPPPPHVLRDGEDIQANTLIRDGSNVMPFGEWVDLIVRTKRCSREDAAAYVMEQIQLQKFLIQP